MPSLQNPEAKTPRRKRFQFSLRTLLIAVIAYGGLWVVTSRWGANQLMREFVEAYPKYYPVMDRDRNYVVCHGRMGSYRSKTYCPAPFILLWRWEFRERPEDVYQSTDVAGRNYFWFLGFRRAMGKDAEMMLNGFGR